MQKHQKYFHLLGIAPTDDKSAIKRAYRKKAMLCHPDRNPSRTAEQEFIALSEAYEVLIGYRKKTTPDTITKTAEEVRAEKIKQAKKRYQQMQDNELKKDARYFEKITNGWRWKFFKILAIYAAIFSFILTVDFFVTGKKRAIPEITTYGFMPKTLFIDEELFEVPEAKYWVGNFPPVQLNYSFFFKDLKSISILDAPEDILLGYSNSDKTKQFQLFEHFDSTEFYSYASVYYVFPFFQIILFLPLFLVRYKRPNINFAIGRLFCLWAIFPCVVFLSLWNGRLFSLFGLM
ncbi:J domain-containing protein [Crocinitomix sp.]|nr:J domain-containing protein [Crocinitomix sp.]